MNSEAEEGQAAGPPRWARSRSSEHPPARTGILKRPVLPSLPGLEDPTRRGFTMVLLQLAVVFRWMEGCWSSTAMEVKRREAPTVRFHYSLHLRGVWYKLEAKSLLSQKTEGYTQRVSMVAYLQVWEYKRRTDSMNADTSGETRKKEVKKLDTALSPVLGINTWDWIVIGVVRRVPPVCNLPGFGRALLYVGANFLACALTRFS